MQLFSTEIEDKEKLIELAKSEFKETCFELLLQKGFTKATALYFILEANYKEIEKEEGRIDYVTIKLYDNIFTVWEVACVAVYFDDVVFYDIPPQEQYSKSKILSALKNHLVKNQYQIEIN